VTAATAATLEERIERLEEAVAFAIEALDRWFPYGEPSTKARLLARTLTSQTEQEAS
jgi:hypothetical protein